MIKNSVLAEVEARIEEVVSIRPLPSLEERFATIETINEEFYLKTGQAIPNFMISMLTDWVLIETLNDKGVDKVSNTEYAILSSRQLRRRDKRENSVEGEVMDYLNLKFTKRSNSLAKKVKRIQD